MSQKVWVANSLILNSTILESQVHENFKILCHFFCSIYFHFDLFWYQCVSLWQKAATFLLIDRKKFWPRGSERLLKMYLSKASDAPHPKLFLNLLSSNFFLEARIVLFNLWWRHFSLFIYPTVCNNRTKWKTLFLMACKKGRFDVVEQKLLISVLAKINL